MTKQTATRKQTEIQQATICRCTQKTTHEVFYTIKSDRTDAWYIIRWNEQALRWECSCPATKPCKHERAVQEVLLAKRAIKAEQEAARERDCSLVQPEDLRQQAIELLFPEKVQAAREAIQVAEQLTATLEKINAEISDDPWAEAPAQEVEQEVEAEHDNYMGQIGQTTQDTMEHLEEDAARERKATFATLMKQYDYQQQVPTPAATPNEVAALAEAKNEEKLAEVRRHSAPDAYEVLAQSKKRETARYATRSGEQGFQLMR